MSEVAQAPHSSPDGNIPQLRFPEFSGGLDNTKFGSIVRKSIYGPRFNADDYDLNGNVKTIRGTDVSLDGEIKYSQAPIANIDEQTVKTHRLVDGDLVMITTADCGLTGIFRKQDYDYISSAYAVKISLKNEVEPYFFKYFFQTDLSKREIKKYIRKATVSNLPGSDILRIKINLPTKPEQQKIAAFLTAVDSKIEQLSKKQELLGEYKKGLMQQIFSQIIRFKADDGCDFPDWEEKKLGSVLDYEQPTNYIVDSTEYDNSFDMPVLTAGKSFVLGYTNETHKVFENTPVIIFDDFTTANKYVDFPFKVKSSAMKILKPKDSFVNIRLIFEFIQMLNFPIGEHKRYWISDIWLCSCNCKFRCCLRNSKRKNN